MFLANAEASQGSVDQAIANYQRAIQDNPRMPAFTSFSEACLKLAAIGSRRRTNFKKLYKSNLTIPWLPTISLIRCSNTAAT